MQGDLCADKEILRKQQNHWNTVFSCNSAKFGENPSEAALLAAGIFKANRRTKILELGAGQGRDTLFFARNGFEICSLDYSSKGIQLIEQKACDNGFSEHVAALQHDVRKTLPFDDESFDACYSHMLYCMAFTTSELECISKEIKRVLRPGGINIFTTRHTGDPQYRTGIRRCEDMWEIEGGFIVHFLSKEKVEHLLKGYELADIRELEEGPLPRKLFMVILQKSKE